MAGIAAPIAVHTRQRGGALLLVLVLILMLAIMGVTFLSVARLAREQARGRQPPARVQLDRGQWPTVSATRLAAGHEELRQLLEHEIERAVRPDGAGGSYRAPGQENVVHESESAYLASRLPALGVVGQFRDVRWPYISTLSGRPFETPTSGVTIAQSREGVRASSVVLTYPQPFDAMPALAGRTRVFPSLVELVDGVPGAEYLAADADGDGIADAALLPLNVPEDTVAVSQVGRPVSYWGAIRVIDDSSAVNINTAWRSSADRTFADLDVLPTDPRAGYLGTFRANVGLYELMRGYEPATALNRASQIVPQALLDDDFETRLPQFRRRASTAQPWVIGEDGSVRSDTEFLTQADALEHQLARRLDFPGYSGANRYRAFEAQTGDELAHRFGLAPTWLEYTELQQTFWNSLRRYAANFSSDPDRRFRYYAANHLDFWYHTVIESESMAGGPRRRFFATSTHANAPTSWNEQTVRKTARHLVVQANPLSNRAPEPLDAFAELPASIKHASAWHRLMPDETDAMPRASANTSPFGQLWRAYWGLFAANERLPVQLDGRPAIPNGLWGAHHQALKRSALAAINTIALREPESFPVPSRAFVVDDFEVTVFGVKKQPFITEALIDRGPGGEIRYIALEVHNPYDRPLDVRSCRLYRFDGTSFQRISLPNWPATLPPQGYITIVSGTRPSDVNAPVGAVTSGSSEMRSLAGAQRIYLMRTRSPDGTPTSGDHFDEQHPRDLVPLDQLNVTFHGSGAGRFYHARYASPEHRFMCVYDGNQTPMSRPNERGSLGLANPVDSVTVTRPFTIPLANASLVRSFGAGEWPENNVVAPGGVSRFPFGGFARDGDLLSIPFIGPSRITPAMNRNAILAMHGVGRDAVYAEDGDPTNDAVETIGHFYPLAAVEGGVITDRYAWAGRLFDFATAIHNPHNDFSPNVDGAWYSALTGRLPEPTPNQAVGTATSLVNNGYEDGIPIEGKININTAPWQTLATLPLVPGRLPETQGLAKAIVVNRETYGPFRTVFDLNRVPEFRDAMATIDFSVDFQTTREGDLSPRDGVANDAEQRLIQLIRLSNLLTTRSDSFTAYVLVQAWMDAGTTHPVLLAEQRQMLFIDRSGLSRESGSLRVRRVPVR